MVSDKEKNDSKNSRLPPYINERISELRRKKMETNARKIVENVLAVLILLAITSSACYLTERTTFIPSTFIFLNELIINGFGINEQIGAIFTIFASTVIMMILMFVVANFFAYSRSIFAISCVLGFFLIGYFFLAENGHVVYDKATKSSYKYYIQTMQGFEFAKESGLSLKHNVEYKLIDDAAKKRIEHFKKDGEHFITEKTGGSYVDENGIEVYMWYSWNKEDPVFYPFPGLDPETNEELEAVSWKKFNEVQEEAEKAQAIRFEKDLLEQQRIEEEKRAAEQQAKEDKVVKP